MILAFNRFCCPQHTLTHTMSNEASYSSPTIMWGTLSLNNKLNQFGKWRWTLWWYCQVKVLAVSIRVWQPIEPQFSCVECPGQHISDLWLGHWGCHGCSSCSFSFWWDFKESRTKDKDETRGTQTSTSEL